MADHVFISYSHDDEAFVHRLAANLQARGVQVWVDDWSIAPGADWDMSIDNALYDCARYLIVLSPASVRSPEVRGELRIALDENKPIVPVLYQDCRIPRRLRVIQYIDFRACGPDDVAALEEVQEALGASKAAPPDGEGRVLSGILTPRQPFEPEMVLIPAGEFLMGSDPVKDKDAKDDEQPQHPLTLPDFYLARTPVTNDQYLAFVRATGQSAPRHWEDGAPPAGKADHPVVYVSWHDAMAYCRWLAQATGKSYTLPSEAEWKKGARGGFPPAGAGDRGGTRIYPWGNKWDSARCNSREGGKGDTTTVGAYPNGASPYGLLDMAGNVWEWTRSLYKGYPYDSADGREDLDAEGARVLHGGAFYFDARHARCAYRSRRNPERWGRDAGLRVVLGPGFSSGL